MPIKTIEKFEVNYLQILDENSKCDEKLKPKLRPNEIKRLYEGMLLSRVYDDRAFKLQRQGRIGTFAPLFGQEAIQAGSALAIQDRDWIVPSFRCEGILISKGLPLEEIFQIWGGDERGYTCSTKLNITPFEITVGSPPIHACGIAYAAKLKKKKIAVVTYFGDGATSEGDFHEAMNFAGVFKLPVIFICQNNQYAISTPVEKQTASKTIAQKAIAYGFPGIKIDGNDAFAVYKATRQALDDARKGKGPTLIECFTYRRGDHTTADDASRYRTRKEVKEWEKKDPIDRLAKYLLNKKIADLDYLIKAKKKVEELIDNAVKKYESIPPADPEEIFNYMYKELPPDLQEQKKELELRKRLKDQK
ncbi:MAG: pyruvate dehydrogenase (acetyl-transferring) E1 component subunit alpha [Candidatus Woesearchaeota archaeon]